MKLCNSFPHGSFKKYLLKHVYIKPNSWESQDILPLNRNDRACFLCNVAALINGLMDSSKIIRKNTYLSRHIILLLFSIILYPGVCVWFYMKHLHEILQLCRIWLESIILVLSSVQCLSRVRLFATPWIAARQASLSITNSRSSPRPTSIKSVMPSSHLILCRHLLLLPPIPPNIRVFCKKEEK